MAAPIAVSDVTGISMKFAVRWDVDFEKLQFDFRPVGAIAAAGALDHDVDSRFIPSNIYRFNDIEHLSFSYRLLCNEAYEMACDHRMGLPIYLEDVLVLIRERIYRVKCNDINTREGLVFDPFVLAQNYDPGDKVTFHCIMSIPVRMRAVISNPEVDPTAVNIVDCESVLGDARFHPHGYDAVNDFRYSSIIPDFNVDMALRMMIQAHQRQDLPEHESVLILKALCLEYLMENLTVENVMVILKRSLDCNVKDLMEVCVDFISRNCRLVPIAAPI